MNALRTLPSRAARFMARKIAPFLSRHGFYLLPKHYYLPIPDEHDLGYVRDTELVGVDMNVDRAFQLLDQVLAPYKTEFNAFPVSKTNDPAQFYLVNGTYMAIDGNAYYALIRHYKPKRIIEIGSGNSTLLAAAAIRKNKLEGSSQPTELTCIEPYPSPTLRNGLPEISRLLECRVQEVGLTLFQDLGANDILFIDSTHVLRVGGDVWWEYCEILPRLAPGVLVHIHDVALPKPYPDIYLKYQWYWNEQYVLQTFLAFNNRFEVVWPGNYLMTKYPEKMQAAFSPEYELMRQQFPSSGPSAFWMRVRA